MAVSTPSATKVVTGKVRLSYAHLFEPFSNIPDQEPKYSCVILIPKSDKATVKKIFAAQAAAAELGKSTKFGGKIPANLASIIKDGDEEADLERNPEYEGHYYMSVSSKTKPGLVDQDVNPILDSTELYSGAYARVSINAFPYTFGTKKGVSFGLNHVQKVADGEFLGGRTKAEDDFDAIESTDDPDDALI